LNYFIGTNLSAGFKPLIGVVSFHSPTSKPNSDFKLAESTSPSASTSWPGTTSNTVLDTTKDIRSDFLSSSTSNTVSPSEVSPSAIPSRSAPHSRSGTSSSTVSPSRKSPSSVFPSAFDGTTSTNLASPNVLSSDIPSDTTPYKASNSAPLNSVSSSIISTSTTKHNDTLPTTVSSKPTFSYKVPNSINTFSDLTPDVSAEFKAVPTIATNSVPIVSTDSGSAGSSSQDQELETQAKEGNSGVRLDIDHIEQETEGSILNKDYSSGSNLTSIVEEEDAEGENKTNRNLSNSTFTLSTNSREALYQTKGD